MTSATEELGPQTGEQVDTATGEIQEQQLAPRSNAGPSISLGLAPLEVDAAWRFANMLARSSMVPKQFMGKPDDVIVAMQLGVEVGLPPMASLQSICVINGRPGLWGDGLLGVIVSFRGYARHEEYYLVAGERCPSASPKDLERDDTRAISRFWRRGNPEPFVGEFSVADAKKAGLWTKDGPWRNYPARMLKMRARSFAARDAFPDALRGMKAAEELLDTPAGEDDIPAVSVRHVPPPEPMRRSEKAAAAAETFAPPVDPGPELTNELPDEPTSRPAAAASVPQKPAGTGSTSRAAATTSAGRKPDSKAQSGNGPSVTTEGLVITETAYVQPIGGDSFWEVKAIVKQDGKAPVGFVFVTKDEALFKIAESCEGTDTKFNITWHGGVRPDKSACKVLDAIQANQ